MKIIGKVNRDAHYFRDLSIGATFICSCDLGQDSPYTYMVTEDVTNHETGELYNAIELGAGEFAFFDNDHPIKRVKAEIHFVP